MEPDVSVPMPKATHPAAVADEDGGLGAAVHHVARGDPDASLGDGKGGADAGLGLAGHIHHDLRVEGGGGAERLAVAGHRRGRRWGVRPLLTADGGDQQGQHHRRIDQPVRKPWKVHGLIRPWLRR